MKCNKGQPCHPIGSKAHGSHAMRRSCTCRVEVDNDNEASPIPPPVPGHTPIPFLLLARAFVASSKASQSQQAAHGWPELSTKDLPLGYRAGATPCTVQTGCRRAADRPPGPHVMCRTVPHAPCSKCAIQAPAGGHGQAQGILTQPPLPPRTAKPLTPHEPATQAVVPARGCSNQWQQYV